MLIPWQNEMSALHAQLRERHELIAAIAVYAAGITTKPFFTAYPYA
jgi:hypothetical protein